MTDDETTIPAEGDMPEAEVPATEKEVTETPAEEVAETGEEAA